QSLDRPKKLFMELFRNGTIVDNDLKMVLDNEGREEAVFHIADLVGNELAEVKWIGRREEDKEIDAEEMRSFVKTNETFGEFLAEKFTMEELGEIKKTGIVSVPCLVQEIPEEIFTLKQYKEWAGRLYDGIATAKQVVRKRVQERNSKTTSLFRSRDPSGRKG